MCGTILRYLKGKTMERTQLTFYKFVEVLVLLHRTESCFFEKEEKSFTYYRHEFPKISKIVYKTRYIEE